MNLLSACGIRRQDAVIAPEDLGLVNEKLALSGWYHDVAELRGLFAPPYFSDDFRVKMRFDGRPVAADDYVWDPSTLTRRGKSGKWRFLSRLLPAADARGAVMRMEVTNRAKTAAALNVQLEVTGGLGIHPHWEFGRPMRAPIARTAMEREQFVLSQDELQIRVGSTLKLVPKLPVCSGVLDASVLQFRPGEKKVFFLALTIGKVREARTLLDRLLRDPAAAEREARAHWRARFDGLFRRLPKFDSDHPGYNKLYYRSMMHLLMNEWHIPEFKLNPYYSTGSVNGGCVCCYLWNYGEPYRLWSLVDPAAAKAHLRTYLELDLTQCFAFHPEDGSAYGPYYPINQEKVLLLTLAYVTQTGDTAFLREKVQGRRIIDHMIAQALMLDDLSKPASLVDYGDGNHHLELRRQLRYDGIVPDLNLRRCVNYHLADQLCKMAGVVPPCDLIERANALRDLIRKELWSKKDGWFFAAEHGEKYLRYTMQMFKALGWGDWALYPDAEVAMIRHLLNEKEFLGSYGVHSLAKTDPAYDERDVDNGGPGACPSFAPAIADRLYQSGRNAEGDEILRRLLWLGRDLPYWGDSHRADVRDYRRDTPLQCDIQGCGPGQTMMFGLFGLKPTTELTVEVSPHLPPDVREMSLVGVRMQGKVFDVKCDSRGFEVICGGRVRRSKYGETIVV